ncbi:hypothetical protein FLACHUCJ7_04310 [Flavobacterium chungangense]|uniref:Uncharacterized protein n=1 Tax=Flavobacterium chungangense TaxID=554283 RepID=A0A6V6ZD92_9FLAO|nr:hypothetical protein FLACHUCJ7_04310 [Flavobacterium chungangense]
MFVAKGEDPDDETTTLYVISFSGDQSYFNIWMA